jgi:RNA polymerase sigma-70 factor, ECF subfamily
MVRMVDNWDIIHDWMQKYGDQITRTIAGMIYDSEAAQDIAQETFIRAYNSLDNFNNKSTPYTYLCRIAYNQVIDYKRAQKRRKIREVREQRYDGTSLLDDLESRDSESHPEKNHLRNEKIAEVRAAMHALPAKFRDTAVLYYLSELGVSEIAEITNKSPGTIKSRLFRARNKLEVLLKDIQEPHDDKRVKVR